MLLLIVRLEAVPGQLNELIEGANTVAEYTRQEPGCLSYGFYQDSADLTSCIFVEQYSDQEALEFHRSQSYFAAFKARLPDLVRSRHAELMWVSRSEEL